MTKNKKHFNREDLKNNIISYLELMQTTKMREETLKFTQAILTNFLQFCGKIEDQEKIDVKRLTDRISADKV